MNKNIDSINYEGIVSIKIIDEKSKRIKNNFIVHNEGSPLLFYFLCASLTGNYSNFYAPTSLDASKNIYKGNGDTFITSLAYRPLISNSNIVKDFKITKDKEDIYSYDYVARFNAIIPYTLLINQDNESATLKCFQLHAKSSQKDQIGSLLAWINVENGVNINAGEAILVEWNLGFANPKQN